MTGAGSSKLAARVSRETQLAMTWDMLGTIFAGALAPGYVRRGQRHNPPIRDDGLRSRERTRRSAATVAKTVAKPLDSTRRTWTTLEYRPSLRPVTDGPGRLAHSYGSEGWGFESLRARPAQRPLAIL